MQIGDIVLRSIIRGGYWKGSHYGRVIAVKGDKVKLKNISFRGPDRLVWVSVYNCRVVETQQAEDK